MQADMRQQPNQLNEVPWNEQSEQRQQTPQRHSVSAAAAAVGSNAACSATTYAAAGKRTAANAHGTVRPAQPARQSQPPKQTARSNLIRICCKRRRIPQRGSAKSRAHYARAPEAPKATAEKKDERRWMVQCGSFKGAEQAEKRPRSAGVSGFDSKITTNNG